MNRFVPVGRPFDTIAVRFEIGAQNRRDVRVVLDDEHKGRRGIDRLARLWSSRERSHGQRYDFRPHALARRGGRQMDLERAAAIDSSGCGCDPPAVQLHQPPDDRQAEAGAAEASRRGRLSLIKAFPDARDLARRESDARVLHAEHNFAALLSRHARGTDPDRATLRRELDRIHQQIGQDLLQALVVGPNAWQLNVWLADLNGEPLVHADHAHTGRGPFDNTERIDRRQMQIERPSFQFGDVEQVVDQ